MSSTEPIQASTKALATARRKSWMERVIEQSATVVGSSVGWMAESGILFAVFAVIWVAIAIGVVWSQGTVEQAWQSIRALPLVIQAIAWVLFLPVMVGLWIWETTWPLLVRLTLLVGIAGWNLLIFLPKSLRASG